MLDGVVEALGVELAWVEGLPVGKVEPPVLGDGPQHREVNHDGWLLLSGTRSITYRLERSKFGACDHATSRMRLIGLMRPSGTLTFAAYNPLIVCSSVP